MSRSASHRPKRRHLHFDALVGLARQRFDRIPDPRPRPKKG